MKHTDAGEIFVHIARKRSNGEPATDFANALRVEVLDKGTTIAGAESLQGHAAAARSMAEKGGKVRVIWYRMSCR